MRISRIVTIPYAAWPADSADSAGPGVAAAYLLPGEAGQAGRLDELDDAHGRLAGDVDVDQLDASRGVGGRQADRVHGAAALVGLDLAGLLADQLGTRRGHHDEREPRCVDRDGDVTHGCAPLRRPGNGPVGGRGRHAEAQAGASAPDQRCYAPSGPSGVPAAHATSDPENQ